MHGQFTFLCLLVLLTVVISQSTPKSNSKSKEHSNKDSKHVTLQPCGKERCGPCHNCVNNKCVIIHGCNGKPCDGRCGPCHNCVNDKCVKIPGCTRPTVLPTASQPCDGRCGPCHNCVNGKCVKIPGCTRPTVLPTNVPTPATSAAPPP